MKRREKWIDSAKGIAILLVIFRHVNGEIDWLSNYQSVYGIPLAVFFLLSGYTLKKQKITWENLNSKFTRLMVPYFVTCVSVLIADVVNGKVLYHDGSIINVTYLIGRNLLRDFSHPERLTVFAI